MTTPELLTFVRSELGRGITKDDINSKLRAQGWTDQDISETYILISKSIPTDVPVESPILDNLVNESQESPLTGQLINEAGFNRTPNTYITNEKPRSNRWKKILIAILVLIFLIAGGIVVYGSGYFLSTDKFFSKLMDPSMKENKSASYQLHAKIDASAIKSDIDESMLGGVDFKIINFDSAGSFDMTDEKNVKMNNKFSMNMGKIEVEVETRSLDGSFYLNIIKAPSLGFISLTPLEDRWIVMNDESGSLEDNPLLADSSLNTDVLSKLTEEQKAHMTKLAEGAHFINITKKHLPEMVDGHLSYNIEFELDEKGIISFFDDFITYLQSIDENGTDFKELKEEGIDKMFEYLDNVKGEAWIGMFDGLIYKVAVKAEIVDTENNQENGRAYVDLNISYSDWGKRVNVVAPSNTITIQALVTELLGGMFGGKMDESEGDMNDVITNDSTLSSRDAGLDKAKDATIKARLANLRSYAELYFDNHQNSYKGFCTDKGESGAYQQAIQLPQNSIYRCNDSETSYAAWTKLSGGDYWCVDSAGTDSSLKSLPKGSSCQQ